MKHRLQKRPECIWLDEMSRYKK